MIIMHSKHIFLVLSILAQCARAQEQHPEADPCEIATAGSPAWAAMVSKIQSRAQWGGIQVVIYSDGEYFTLIPKSSIKNYAKGTGYGSVREVEAPSATRDRTLKELALSEFIKLHKDFVTTTAQSDPSDTQSGKLNIVVDSYNLPIEHTAGH